MTASAKRQGEIDAVCGGWSHALHWKFFAKIVTPGRTTIRDVCMLGVYQGRDIAYLKSINPSLRITGIDLFSAEPMADWCEDAKTAKATWERAVNAPAPTMEKAIYNLATLGCLNEVALKADRAEEFLAKTAQRWDLIYIDTSHDYETTIKTIRAAAARADLLAGDDYSNQGTWGVARAVQEAFSEHQVFGGFLWLAESRHLQGG